MQVAGWSVLDVGSPLAGNPSREDRGDDRCLLAWVGPRSVWDSGVWDSSWRRAHINVFEIRAVYLALMAFMLWIRGKHVLVISDSITAVCFINHQGGIRSAG